MSELITVVELVGMTPQCHPCCSSVPPISSGAHDSRPASVVAGHFKAGAQIPQYHSDTLSSASANLLLPSPKMPADARRRP